MPTPQQLQLLDALIQSHHIGHWLETSPTGLRTKQLTEAGIRWKTNVALVGILVLVWLRLDRHHISMAWFWGILVLYGLLMLGRTYWRLELDFSANQIHAGIGNIGIFQRDLSTFKGFTTTSGHRFNGIDRGGSLYLEFEGKSRLLLATLRNPQELEHLQTVLLRAVAWAKQWNPPGTPA